MTSLRLLLVLGFICAARGNKIVNGDDADSLKYPFMVIFLFGDDYIPEVNGFFCSGTILDEYHVLSAAHCFYGYPDVTEYTVVARKNGLTDDSGMYREVSEFIYHPGFNNDTYENDLIIVKVAKPFKWSSRVQPANLALDDRSVNKKNCYMVGYGWDNEEEQTYPEVMQEYRAKRTSRKKCVAAAEKANRPDTWFGTGDSIKGYMSCTRNKNQGGCWSDSGGPLGCFDRRTGDYLMIGVRSWVMAGYPCAKGWNIYMRVSKFNDFISSNVPDATFA